MNAITTDHANARRRDFGTFTATTSDVTRDFFEWLEHRYGSRFGGRPLPMDGDKSKTKDQIKDRQDEVVVTRNSLELEDLQRLFNHEITVLRVREFYPRTEAASLGMDLAKRAKLQQTEAHNWKVSTSKGLESSDVMTTGRHLPYNVAVANQGTESYFEEVRNELRTRRGLPLGSEDMKNTKHKKYAYRSNNGNDKNTNFGKQQLGQRTGIPTLWPLDLLRLELDELWPVGAGLARAHHQKSNPKCMGGGLPRLMVGPTRWKKGLVHVDELSVLSTETGCFSANIYLQLPYRKATQESDNDHDDEEEQPVMEIWPLNIRSKWDWYRPSDRVALKCINSSSFILRAIC